LPQNILKNIQNHSKLTIVAGYQIGKPIKLVAEEIARDSHGTHGTHGNACIMHTSSPVSRAVDAPLSDIAVSLTWVLDARP